MDKKIIEKKIDPNEPKVVFDYKNPDVLRKFITEQGRISPRSRTGLTAKEQRDLTRSVKRARMLALLPFAG